MNNVTIIGRLTKDVDLRYYQSANGQFAVGRFTVAVNRPPKQDGKREADFITCYANGARAETIANYFHKGSSIGLCGEIRTGSYQRQDGTTVYTTEVEVKSIDFIDPKNTQPNATVPEYNMQQGQQYYQQAAPQMAAAPAQPAQPKQQSAKKAAQPAQVNVQPQQAQLPPDIAAQGGWATADQLVDEGLPFN